MQLYTSFSSSLGCYRPSKNCSKVAASTHKMWTWSRTWLMMSATWPSWTHLLCNWTRAHWTMHMRRCMYVCLYVQSLQVFKRQEPDVRMTVSCNLNFIRHHHCAIWCSTYTGLQVQMVVCVLCMQFAKSIWKLHYMGVVSLRQPTTCHSLYADVDGDKNGEKRVSYAWLEDNRLLGLHKLWFYMYVCPR